MRCVLAVDGGNSKTLALVATLDGTILSVERGACGDIYNAIPTETARNPTAAALENVELTVTTALRSAHVARKISRPAFSTWLGPTGRRISPSGVTP